jgi:Tol biopolymer transport system component
MRWVVVGSLLAAACGSGTAVSQTSSGVADPNYAPLAEQERASRTASGAAIPDSQDANERILYLREGSVWSMHADGSEQNEITVRAAAAPDEAPALGPGGNFAFASARDGASKIYVANLEEGIARAITDGADGGDREPAWSPDGKRIAFVRGDPHDQRHLYVVDVAGGAPTALVEGDDDHPERVGAPTWSPDGKRMVFAADRRGGHGTLLWLVDSDGKNLARLTAPRQGAWFIHDRRPAWAPDGSVIAFASNRHVSSGDHATDFDIYAIRPDGSELVQLTEDPGVADNPTFSPDGNRIFFASTRDAKNDYEVEIYVMPAAGGDQRRMTRDERPQNSSPSAGRTKPNQIR